MTNIQDAPIVNIDELNVIKMGKSSSSSGVASNAVAGAVAGVVSGLVVAAVSNSRFPEEREEFLMTDAMKNADLNRTDAKSLVKLRKELI